ncbi:MAG TPA: HAMP domain-containing sensor histidine kinase [Anaerolineae bacterium]|nr:HAMP domain-containing sensor histidine kinase [Anaerolineae bacterium]
MSSESVRLQRMGSPLAFLGGVVITLIVAIVIIELAMQPPSADLEQLIVGLLLTSLGSFVVGYALYRLGWWRWPRRILHTLILGSALQAALVFFNVWITARNMFLNAHDLELAIVLLLFGAGIAVSFGAFVAASLARGLRRVEQTAERLADGDLSARVEIDGRDEIARLATTFNRMADQLEAVARQQHELDTLRRDLIAWTSHDLRTPLTSIRVIVEALADSVIDDPDTVQRYLNSIRSDVAHLNTLIDDLFELAQLDAGGLRFDKVQVSLTDLISDVLERMRALAERRRVRLEGQVAPQVDPVTLDPQKIERVLTNLIGNAIRHTPEGGQVMIDAQRRDGTLRVTVSDSGEGIPAEDLPHVFERFYRGEKSRARAGGGAGLGLAIAKGIVEAHGGTIEVASNVGSGSAFTFTLPG